MLLLPVTVGACCLRHRDHAGSRLSDPAVQLQRLTPISMEEALCAWQAGRCWDLTEEGMVMEESPTATNNECTLEQTEDR